MDQGNGRPAGDATEPAWADTDWFGDRLAFEPVRASHGSGPGIAVFGLSVAYGPRTLIDRIEFEVAPGCCTGLHGPAGSGKSSLVKVLSGRLPARSGRIELAGWRPTVNRPGRRPASPRYQGPAPELVGVLPQEPMTVLDPWGNVGQAVAGPITGQGRSRRLDRSARSGLVRRHLELVGLGEIDPATPNPALTGAQARLVVLASVLIASPVAVLADEPTAGLDGHQAATMTSLLRAAAGRGAAVLVTSRHRDLLDRFCHAIITLAAPGAAGADEAPVPPADLPLPSGASVGGGEVPDREAG